MYQIIGIIWMRPWWITHLSSRPISRICSSYPGFNQVPNCLLNLWTVFQSRSTIRRSAQSWCPRIVILIVPSMIASLPTIRRLATSYHYLAAPKETASWTCNLRYSIFNSRWQNINKKNCHLPPTKYLPQTVAWSSIQFKLKSNQVPNCRVKSR